MLSIVVAVLLSAPQPATAPRYIKAKDVAGKIRLVLPLQLPSRSSPQLAPTLDDRCTHPSCAQPPSA